MLQFMLQSEAYQQGHKRLNRSVLEDACQLHALNMLLQPVAHNSLSKGYSFFFCHLFLPYLLPCIKQEVLTFFKGRDKRQNKLMHAPKCTNTLTHYRGICLSTDSRVQADIVSQQETEGEFCSVSCDNNEPLQEKEALQNRINDLIPIWQAFPNPSLAVHLLCRLILPHH